MTPESAARRVLQHALIHRPTLGSGRLVALDGPSGSGKSTLADAISRATSAQVIRVDQLFPGWEGQPEIVPRLRRLLAPMAHGEPGHWRRWDYDHPRGRWAEWHRVHPGGLLVLDGVGSASRPWDAWTTTRVWVEAPRSVRLARGVERNDGMDEHWRRWQVGEDALFVREHTRARADVVVHTHDE